MSNPVQLVRATAADDALVEAMGHLVRQLSPSAALPSAEDLRDIIGSDTTMLLLAKENGAIHRNADPRHVQNPDSVGGQHNDFNEDYSWRDGRSSSSGPDMNVYHRLDRRDTYAGAFDKPGKLINPVARGGHHVGTEQGEGAAILQ